MKKLIFITCILFSQLCLSQNKIQERRINFKNIKIGLACAGANLLAGAITNVIRTYQIEPVYRSGANIESFNQSVIKYKEKQNDMQRVSSMFYGFSAASLISICFNF